MTAPGPERRASATGEELRAQAVLLAGELAEASRRLRAALEEKDRLSRLLDRVLESLDTGVILSAPDGRILAVNGAARRMRAVEPAGDGTGLAHGAWFASWESDGADRPFRPLGPEGPTWVAREALVPLPGGGDGRLLTVQDVTRAVRLEEQAGRRSRLEALGRMAAEIAHEVRNPLGSLELFAAMLADELQDRPDSHELATQILLGVRQLAGTVTHLLSAVRGRPLMRSAIDAAALARDACEAVAPIAAARGIELEAPCPVGPVPAAVDVEGVRQALLNLIGNALDMSPAGGRVRVSAARNGPHVVFEVADSGPGVPIDLRERIFEPFFTTREQGTGLGLAVVERVALSHGGAVEITDDALGGALFRLVIPDRQTGRPAADGAPGIGFTERRDLTEAARW